MIRIGFQACSLSHLEILVFPLIELGGDRGQIGKEENMCRISCSILSTLCQNFPLDILSKQ